MKRQEKEASNRNYNYLTRTFNKEIKVQFFIQRKKKVIQFSYYTNIEIYCSLVKSFRWITII